MVLRIESDGGFLYRVVDAATGDRLMCGFSDYNTAERWARGRVLS